MRVSLPVDSGQYISDSHTLSNRHCINLYPSNPADDGAQARGALISWPGTDLISETALNPRAKPIKADGKLYIATLDNLYAMDSAENLSLAASVPGVSSNSVMAWNGVVLVIVCPNSAGWFYNPSTGVATEITDTVFTDFQAEADGVESVCFVDGRFVYCTKKTIFWGSLITENSGQNFDALATLSPFLTENMKAVRNVRGDLYAFGEEFSKPFATTGDSDLPFQEITQGTVDKGSYSESSVVSFDSSFFMVGNGPDESLGVYRGAGTGAMQKISTDYLDSVIKDVTDETSVDKNVTLCGFSYRGRGFILLTMVFASDSKYQFLYDIQSSSIRGYPVWIRLISNYETDSESTPSGSFFSFFLSVLTSILDIPFVYLVEYNDSIYSPSISGLERLNENKAQRAIGTTPSPVLFTTPYISGNSNGTIINRVELVMDTGTSNDPDLAIQDTNITVKMRYTDTGGNTWVDCGSRSIGKNAKYDKRLVWSGLGMARTDRMFEFSSTMDSSLKFVRVDLDIEGTVRNR